MAKKNFKKKKQTTNTWGTANQPEANSNKKKIAVIALIAFVIITMSLSEVFMMIGDRSGSYDSNSTLTPEQQAELDQALKEFEEQQNQQDASQEAQTESQVESDDQSDIDFEAEQAKLEEQQKALEEMEQAEAEKKAAEEQAQLEAEQKAAEEKAAQEKAAQEKAEAEKKAAEEKAAKEKAEAEKKAAEEKAAKEAAESQQSANANTSVNASSLVSQMKVKVTTEYTNGRDYTKAKANLTSGSDSLKKLKEAGYTVKYEFYKASKKSGSYTLFGTTTDNSCVNQTGEEDFMYYYKAVIKVYNGSQLVASTSLDDCESGMRIWDPSEEVLRDAG